MIRDIYQSRFFRRISFSKEPFKDRTGLIVRATNRPEQGITMIGLIYIKEEDYEKDYEIAAIDQQNRVSHNVIHIVNRPVLKNNKSQPYKPGHGYQQSENRILEDFHN